MLFKDIKMCDVFFPNILASHRFPCLLAVVRESIEAN